MRVRTIKEFYCIVDMILATVKRDDVIDIELVYSGIINRENSGKMERIHVKNALAKIHTEYTESGLKIQSTTSKKVASWLGEFKSEGNIRVNSYLSFISSIDSIEINSIVVNGTDLIKRFNNSSNIINLMELSKYVTDNSRNGDIRYIITDGQKLMTFMYTNGVFTRLVKLNDEHTLYINDEVFMSKIMNKYTLYSFSFCTGMPEVMSQIELFRRMAEVEGKTFNYMTSNRK